METRINEIIRMKKSIIEERNEQSIPMKQEKEITIQG